MTQLITLQRPDGGTTQAACFEPTSPLPGRPGLIVLHEWWGLDTAIQEVGQRLADLGLTVLIPDLYHGQLARTPDEAGQLMARLDKLAAVQQDIRASVTWFKQSGRRVGVLGFCMGGALTVAAAVHLPDIDAAVCFYGIPPAELADPARIRVPLQGHFALQDGWCTPELARELQATLTAAGQHPDIHFYPAQHAFFNHRRPDVHDPAQAALALSRTRSFLGAHLGTP